MHSRSSLTFAAWNIDGLHSRIGGVRTSKIDFTEVQNSLKHVDIFCLSETHCEASDKINLDGYFIVQNNRPRSLNAPHAFGGLAVGVKVDIVKGVKFLASKHSEFLWFKLCKTFFGLKTDLYICSLYISPASSGYSQRRDDIFSLIENDIVKYSSLGDCLIMGDFNARTNIQPDYIENDSSDYLCVPSSYVSDVPMARNNIDVKEPDAHGKQLLDLCKGSGLRILNGRKLGDLQGNYTCFSHRGSPSVIDYMLCNSEFFSSVNYFKVHDLIPFSIHCIISCTIDANWCFSDNVWTEDTMQLIETPNQYCWSSNSARLWNWSLNHELTRSEIQSFETQSSDMQISVDDCLQNFYSMLHNTAKRAGLKRKSSKHAKRSSAKNTWYDVDCKVFYRQLKSLARNIKTNPQNITLIHMYRKLRKKYVKLLSSKKFDFRRSIFQKLDNLQSNDPQAFWKIYDELCAKKNNVANPISPQKWWNHFLALMNRNIPHSDKDFEDTINNFVLCSHDNNSLDFTITSDEVIGAAKHLKKGKSPGVDGIRAEMVKDGISLLAPSLANLFNLIFTSGNFPEAWRLSSLTPIHKKGDKSIPNNYRGIAVSSILCKLFCLVLYNRLDVFVNQNSSIPPNQIGFKKGSRTSDHVLVLKSLIDKYINRAGKSYLYVCFIDFSSAFDTVWRNALLYKLTQIGIGGTFLNIINDMYRSVSFAVKCGNKLTDSFETTVGYR